MSKFKETQTFILSEVEFGKYKYSKSAKEFMLLYLDASFKMLIQIEDLIIKNHYTKFTAQAQRDIMSFMLNKSEYISKVIFHHNNFFSKELFSIWEDIHKPYREYISFKLKQLVDSSIEASFKSIGELIIEEIDMVRFEIYEIDRLASKQFPIQILTVTNTCMKLYEEMKIVYPAYRAQIYIDKLDAQKGFSLRDYTDEPMRFIECKRLIEREGINVLS